MQQVFCKDCKHSFTPWADKFSIAESRYTMRCKLAFQPEEIDNNYVTGHKMKPAHYETCAMARTSLLSTDSKCGHEGKNWEPKHKRDLFKFIKHVGET